MTLTQARRIRQTRTKTATRRVKLRLGFGSEPPRLSSSRPGIFESELDSARDRAGGPAAAADSEVSRRALTAWTRSLSLS